MIDQEKKSSLPSNLEELLKQLQNQNIEEFASKLVCQYMKRLSKQS